MKVALNRSCVRQRSAASSGTVRVLSPALLGDNMGHMRDRRRWMAHVRWIRRSKIKKNMHAHFSSEAGAADRGKRQLAQEQQEARA